MPELPAPLPEDMPGEDDNFILPTPMTVDSSMIPVVVPVRPARTRWLRSPWPGWWGACLTTFVFWLMLLVSIIVIVLPWLAALILSGKDFRNEAQLISISGDAVPASIHALIAWSFAMAYGLGLIVSIVALRMAVGKEWVRQIGLRRLPFVPLMIAAIAFPGFVLGAEFTSQAALLIQNALLDLIGLPRIPELKVHLGEQFAPYHWSLMVLSIGIAPGVVEELWCRGFLGQGLVGRNGLFGGVVLTSLLFGLLHNWPPVYVITTALMGAALHFAYLMSRSLWVPILIHAGNNSLAGLLEMKRIDAAAIEAAADEHALVLAVLVFGLLIVSAYAMWSCRGQLIHPDGRPAQAEHPGVIVPSPRSGVYIHHDPPYGPALVLAGILSGSILTILIFG